MRLLNKFTRIHLYQFLGFLATLVVWQIISLLIPPIFFASPIATGRALVDVIASGDIIIYLQETFSAYLAGFALAIGFGVPFGIIVGYFRSL